MQTTDMERAGPRDPGGARIELGAILSASPLGLVIASGEDGRAIYANERAVELLGRPVVGSRVGEWSAWFRQPDRSALPEDELPMARALRGARVDAQELVVVRPDGRVSQVEAYATPLSAPSDPEPRAVLGIWDITRQRRAEEQVLFKLDQLETTLAALPDVYFRVDRSGTILDARSGRTSTWNVEPLIGKRIDDAFGPETRRRLEQTIDELRGDALATMEYEQRTGDGFRWHEVRVLTLSPEELVLIVRDVTELKEAEERLRAREKRFRESEERFRAAVEHAPMGVALVDLDGRFLKVNRAFSEIVGHSEPALIGATFERLSHPEDVGIGADESRRLMAGEISHYHVEKRLLHEDGHPVSIFLSAAVVRGADDEPRMVVTEMQDTSEQKAIEEQLRSSVAEKVVLLREIHHRVKNNLQVISSILGLQGQKSESPDVRAMFEDSRSRIQTMALVHERLYHSENLAYIDFGEHLRDLVAMLVSLYGAEDCEVHTELAVEPVTLDLDSAIPLGLVASELITNALKHAFRGRTEGTVYVTLRHREGTLTLTVADDGVGFPSGFPAASSSSLGMRIIGLLTHQLRGEIAFTRSPRNAASLRAPVESRVASSVEPRV